MSYKPILEHKFLSSYFYYTAKKQQGFTREEPKKMIYKKIYHRHLFFNVTFFNAKPESDLEVYSRVDIQSLVKLYNLE